MSSRKEGHDSLHPNGLSFVSKGTKNGRTVHMCRLNRDRWTRIDTPTYHEGMSFEEAKRAWLNYCALVARVAGR